VTPQFPATQMLVGAIFVLCLATTVAGALLAALSARIIRSVCGLAICCIGLAGLYYFLHSPFLALMEILIYVGAVCVTIVFAVMLAEPDEPVREEKWGSAALWGVLAFVVCAALFWGLWRLGAKQDWTAPATRVNDGSVSAIGKSLLTTYSMAFELISLALLVAIIGALAVARTGRTKP
jgi:NADH:ubiquinone oxidoreductase subunit 6 (subunit J)